MNREELRLKILSRQKKGIQSKYQNALGKGNK